MFSVPQRDPVVVLCWGHCSALEVVIDGVFGTCKATRPILTKELLGQLEGLGQECCPLPCPLLWPFASGLRGVSGALLADLLGQLSRLLLLPCIASLAI